MGPARSHCATLLPRRQVVQIIDFIAAYYFHESHYNYTHSTVEAQTQLSVAVEKERSATERTMTLQSRVTVLENQTASLRQEKSRLTASLELEKAKAETLEEGQQR